MVALMVVAMEVGRSSQMPDLFLERFLIEHDDRLHVECERKGGVKGDSRLFALSEWKDELAIN